MGGIRTKAERLKLIKAIEKERKSKIIVCVLGDRRNGMETKIAGDLIPLFFKHLSDIGEQKTIDLYLYSTGGLIMAGYGLVNLIREFCENFNVIIPFKAYSCATLISMGANEIVMTKLGQLSPIDPSIDHPLNPIVPHPQQPQLKVRIPVSVEDVNAYIDLAKKEANLKKEECLQKVFENLSQNVNPLVLGAVHRSREEIQFLARILLGYHIEDTKVIDEIVNLLTRERFSHQYIIGKNEAKNILKFNIIEPSNSLNNNILDLFNFYTDIMKLNEPYNAEVILGSKDKKVEKFNRAIIESNSLTHVFRSERELVRVPIPPQPNVPPGTKGVLERTINEGWELDNKI